MKRKGCCSHPRPLPKCPTRLKNHLSWEKNVSNAAEKEKWKSWYFQRKLSPVQVEKTRLLASLSSLLILIKDFTTASTLKNIFSFGICAILPIGKHLLNIICCQKSSISTFVEWLPRTSSRWKSSSSCCSVLTYEISAWDVLYLRWRESPRSFPSFLKLDLTYRLHTWCSCPGCTPWSRSGCSPRSSNVRTEAKKLSIKF